MRLLQLLRTEEDAAGIVVRCGHQRSLHQAQSALLDGSVNVLMGTCLELAWSASSIEHRIKLLLQVAARVTFQQLFELLR